MERKPEVSAKAPTKDIELPGFPVPVNATHYCPDNFPLCLYNTCNNKKGHAAACPYNIHLQLIY